MPIVIIVYHHQAPRNASRISSQYQRMHRKARASSHAIRRVYTGGGPVRIPASMSGTARPIVSFKHVNSAMSVPFGSDITGATLALRFCVPFNTPESYPSSMRTTLLARKYCIAFSGRGTVLWFVYGVGELVVLSFERYEEQLAFTVPISEDTVLSSASTMKVELVFFEWNRANSSGPPGRDVLSG